MDSARLSPEILLSHADFVRRLARSLLFDREAAEDVAQDALVAALERPPRAESSLRCWLARVTQNLARQSRRSDGRRAIREHAAARSEALPGPEQVVEHEAARAAVVRALLALPEPSRSALILHYYEGLSARSIAARLDLPLETVRTRIRRGLERMRGLLAASDELPQGSWARALYPLTAAGVERGALSAALAPGLVASVAAKLGTAAVVAAVAVIAWRAFERGSGPSASDGPVSTRPAWDPPRSDDARKASDAAVQPVEPSAAEREPQVADSAADALAAPEPPATPPGAEVAASTVALLGHFVAPDHGELVVPAATVLVRGSKGGWTRALAANASSVPVVGLAPDVYTVQVQADGFEHREQVMDLSSPERASRGRGAPAGSEPVFEERLVLWPPGWVAVVVLTPDGRPFEELAGELGLERKRILVDAFDVRTRLDPPDAEAWSQNSPDEPAFFRKPPSYQSWELPGSCVGSLQLRQPPPFWVGLSVHLEPLGWELLQPHERQVVFRLDAAAFAARFARLALRVVDARGGGPLSGARITFKADTSAHRRGEHTDASSDAEGRVALERIVPGRYGLDVTLGEALYQDWIDLDPGEARDLGDIALELESGVPVRVVDAEGRPARAWIEIASYQRGARTDQLYHPNLHRLTGDDGEYLLPMPTRPSIVRATLAIPPQMHPSDDSSGNVLLDPSAPPPGPLVLVLREPIPVGFELGSAGAAAIEVVDALGLVVGTPPLPGREGRGAELVPGSYRARLLDAAGGVLSETRFEVTSEPLRVVLP